MGESPNKKTARSFQQERCYSGDSECLSCQYHDEWDLFLTWPIQNSYLELVRKRCIVISDKHSGSEKGKDIATSGEAELYLILEELKNHA
ncbi:MAG TPA: hypothetical protein VK949_01395 [Methylotenera sp.]|nr:hypothetical protein [Methylotenera sp.]